MIYACLQSVMNENVWLVRLKQLLLNEINGAEESKNWFNIAICLFTCSGC